MAKGGKRAQQGDGRKGANETEEREYLNVASTMADPFIGRDPCQPRLLWHPKVHAAYGERCVFFRIRVHKHHLSASVDELDSLLRGIGVRAYSIYPLWGYYDFLVRTWLTPLTRTRVMETLDQAIGLVADYEEFQTEQIVYIWSIKQGAPEPSQKLIETHRQDIEQLHKELSFTLLERLWSDGLIYVLPPMPEIRVRFFVSVSSMSAVESRRVRGSEQIIAKLHDLDDPWISVYSGIGFASHIIRFSMRAYSDVYETISGSVANLAETFAMRTITMLVAPPHVPESDRLETRLGGIGSVLATLASILGEGFESTIAELPDERQDALRRVFRTYSSDLLGTSFERLFLSLFLTRIREDAVALNSELGLLGHFELLFKDYAKRVLEEGYGETWRETVKGTLEAIPQLKKVASEKFEIIGLGAVAQVLNKCSETLNLSLVEKHLGSSWAATVDKVANTVRNKYAHGLTYDPAFLRSFLANWEENSVLLCDVGLLYLGLSEG